MRRDPQGEELREMLNAITTNKTDFFRERHHFVHEADTARFLRAKALAGQRVTPHLADADRVHQLRHDDRGGEAPAELAGEGVAVDLHADDGFDEIRAAIGNAPAEEAAEGVVRRSVGTER